VINIQESKDSSSQVSVNNRQREPLTIRNIIERFVPFNKFIKFCVVGGLGTFLNLFILYLSVELFGLWYIYGAAFSFVIVITFNFSLNKIWTFKDRERESIAVTGQYLTYVVIGGVGMAINIASLYILVEYFHIQYLLAELIAILIATLWNFQGTRFLVFKSDGARSRQ
jgi:putative flippase GtrA